MCEINESRTAVICCDKVRTAREICEGYEDRVYIPSPKAQGSTRATAEPREIPGLKGPH